MNNKDKKKNIAWTMLTSSTKADGIFFLKLIIAILILLFFAYSYLQATPDAINSLFASLSEILK